MKTAVMYLNIEGKMVELHVESETKEGLVTQMQSVLHAFKKPDNPAIYFEKTSSALEFLKKHDKEESHGMLRKPTEVKKPPKSKA